VDTHQRDGVRLPQVTTAAPSYSTDVYRAAGENAERRIASVIAANTGVADEARPSRTASAADPRTTSRTPVADATVGGFAVARAARAVAQPL